MDPFIGELRLFGFNFAPRGWALAQGQILPIAQYTALFSLLGTTYGGNGQTNFALPDLRGRAPISFGQGPGLSAYDQGQVAGQEQVTLIGTQIPAHNHTVGASSSATSKNPADSFPAFTAAASSYGSTADLTMNAAMVSGGGGNQPHDNMQPYLVLNWCI
ncbi:MAG TPA: tail fiber protein, partial [Microlunatus sp.]|nr:tail fiber protein [Microlunatus sp.]